MKEVVYVSFEEAYEEFKIYAKKRHKKESFNTNQYIFKARIIPYFVGKELLCITKDDILKWQDIIEQLHFSNSYNRLLYFNFCEFLDYCVQYLDYPENYLRSLGTFQKHYEKKKIDFYTLKEFRCFIKGFKRNELVYKAFFEFMFFAGTRPGEAMALQFRDIHGDYVEINKTITSHCGREFDFPKTVSSVRMIKIHKKLKKRLLKLKKMYIGCCDDYFVFGGLKPLAPTSINRYKKKACSRSGIRPITLHQFRHSHATLLVSNGILINEVSRRLGHSNVSTTLNVYTHSDLSQEKRVLKTLNSLSNRFF